MDTGEVDSGVIFSSVLIAGNGMLQISYSEPADREDDIVTWRTTEAHIADASEAYDSFLSALADLLDAILIVKRDRARAKAERSRV